MAIRGSSTHASVVLREVGTTCVVTIPYPLRQHLGWEEGDIILLDVINGTIVMTREEPDASTYPRSPGADPAP